METTGSGAAAKPAATARKKVHRITLSYGPPFVAAPRVARVLPGDELLFVRLGGDPEQSIRITFEDPEPFSVAVFEHKGLDTPKRAVKVRRPLKGLVHYKCDLLGADGKLLASSELESTTGGPGGGLEPETGDARRD